MAQQQKASASPKKKKTANYVDKKRLLADMIEYKEKMKLYDEGRWNHKSKPQVSNYVATSIILIAENLATIHKFNGYIFKDEMVADGILNVIQYIDNFDPYKYDNPFAYFTTIIYYAFLRRIKKEKKSLKIKLNMYDNLILEMELDGLSSEINNIKSTLSNTKNKVDIE